MGEYFLDFTVHVGHESEQFPEDALDAVVTAFGSEGLSQSHVDVDVRKEVIEELLDRLRCPPSLDEQAQEPLGVRGEVAVCLDFGIVTGG